VLERGHADLVRHQRARVARYSAQRSDAGIAVAATASWQSAPRR